MGIRGITDKGVKLPVLGTLRKGAPKPDRGPGKDLDYWRFDTEDPTAKALFEQVYGTEPRTIRVVLPYNTIDENWQAWKEEWSSSSLKHRCDGETCVLHQLPNGTYSTAPVPCPGNCKQAGYLTVILPELQRFAAVTVLTTSIHDIMQLQGNLETLALNGTVRGIPLMLSRVPKEISVPNLDKNGNPLKDQKGQPKPRARRVKWLVQLEPQPKWLDIFLTGSENAARALAQGVPPQMLALPPAPSDIEEEDEMELAMSMDLPVERPAEAAPVPPAVASAYDDLLLAYAEKIKGKSGKAFYDAMYAKKSQEEKRKLVQELDLGPVKEVVTVEAEVVEADEVDTEFAKALRVIDDLSAELLTLQVSADDVQALRIRLLPKGIDDMNHCSLGQLEEILVGLELAIGQQKKK